MRWQHEADLPVEAHANDASFFHAEPAQARSGIDEPTPPQQRRALDLLMENLTGAQQRDFLRYGCFDVIGGESGKRYRLWHCFHQNIEELDAYRCRVCLWCFQPGEARALADVLLAQKAALELFERDAMRIANRYSDFSPNSGRDITRGAPAA